VKPFLLDVNVLVALFWRTHIHHRAANLWLEENRHAGIRTCPITQAGFVRITSHPRFSGDRMTVAEAQTALNSLLIQPEHEFWPDSLQLAEAIGHAGSISGHHQITDAYLVALAIANGGRLATFDRGPLVLAGAKGVVELILS
jgi:toxin-antitoxin system PIN domain toxin